jgi:glutamate-1-semialdehyde 2,1-aminomutase
MSPKYDKSMALFQRASAVIPGGIYGHAAPAATVPGAFPYFAERAEGSRYWDVDGNEFIDLMCGYGPILLGYNHPEINAVTAEVQARGDCFNHPTDYTVQLAEKLAQQIEGADWAVFGKNGTDMTSWSIRVAREFTGKKRIAKAKQAYHGVDPWCVPGYGGIIAEDRAQIDSFEWNSVESLHELVKREGENLAAIMITPFHHPNFADSQLPNPDFVTAMNELCEKHGILLILDDVRCGFRLHSNGSHCSFGFNPDLMCYSKALGNGYPISACAGKRALKVAASKCFLTGSFWNAAVPIAAALKTLEIAGRENLPKQLEINGEQLVSGMLALGESHGVPLQSSGPGAMPYVRVAEDTSFHKQQALCVAAVEQGLYLHPHHNWFLSAAHTTGIIEECLKRFEAALKSCKSTLNL